MSLHPALAAVRIPVRRALGSLEAGATVLVACSGGADSLALLSAAIFEGHKLSHRVIGVTVDHGLQEGSAEHALDVVQQMAAMGADEAASGRVIVVNDGVGIEAAARESRYAMLDQMAIAFEASVVLLGHTRDDQAETVLLGLARGAGGRSIAGMRPAFDLYLRPLLGVSRDDTVTACQVGGLDFWSDPQNDDLGFTRVRVRKLVLPALEEHLGPGVAAALARTAEQLRVDMDYLDEQAEAAFTLDIDLLATLPTAIRRRVLRLAAVRAGAIDSELFYDHVTALDELVTDWHGQRWIDLPGHIRGLRESGHIRFA